MRRRDFITLLGGAVSWPLAARGEDRRAVPLVGVLLPGLPNVPGREDNFFAGMRALGYVEGRNIIYQRRWGRGTDEALATLASELVDLKPNVIVVSGGRAIDAVLHATRVIPVVVPFTSDILGQGFVSSLARPQGNITGLSAMSSEISAKRIELIKETFPKLARLAVVWNSALAKDARWGVIETTARSLGVGLKSVEIRSIAAFDGVFDAMLADHVDAVYVINDRFTSTNQLRVIELA